MASSSRALLVFVLSFVMFCNDGTSQEILDGILDEFEDEFDDDVIEALEDELEDEFAEDFVDGELAETYQQFSIVGIAPGASGAKYRRKGDDEQSDLEISSVKIPIRRDFKSGAVCFVASDDKRYTDYEIQPLRRVRSSDALCARSYGELTLSYLRADQRTILDDIGVTEFDLNIDTFSVLAGYGLIFEIAEGTTFRPILLGGYSHIDNDSVFEGDLAETFNEELDGIDVNSELNSLLVGGAAEFRHERLLGNDVELETRLRYNYLVSDVYDASDEALEGTNDFVVINARLEAGIPTGFRLFSRDIYALAFGGTNAILDGVAGDVAKDSFIHELGGGLELKTPRLVQGVRLRSSVLFGEDVFGWRAGLAVKF